MRGDLVDAGGDETLEALVHLAAAEPQAVVVNAGVANAATGQAGEEDAERTAAHAAARLGLAPAEVLVLSTGVIGPRLPMAKLLAGVDEAAVALSPGGGPSAAEAILTTDAGSKTAVAARRGFTVGGMAKGAGMIHPRLATMLAVVTTDYALAEGEADELLRPAVERTFNRISVDGDCSTNDAVVLLARRADADRDSSNDASFAAALDSVCADLARQIVADGEGATVVLEGDVPSPVNPPSGCTFHPRCSYRAALCSQSEPSLDFSADGHGVACHVFGPIKRA